MSPAKASAHDLSGAVFISHASEDKEGIARPLAEALRERGLRVWYDEFVLEVGDSLRESIDEGLAISEFGVVILSSAFFSKRWTRRELNALIARENEDEHDVIFPIWHEVGRREVAEFSLLLADRVALRSADGVETLADKIVLAIERSPSRQGDSLPPTVITPGHKPPPAARAGEEGSLIEWHPAVHELWGHSHLLLGRLGFSLPATQTSVVEGLERALSSVGSSAYVYDESFGVEDGLLKVWLPEGVSTNQMVDALSRNLQQLRSINWFKVDGIIRHWIWMSRNGRGLQVPDSGALANPPTPEIIRRASNDELEDSQLGPLLQAGLLTRVARVEDAAGFFVAVRGPTTTLLRRELQSELERILDASVGIDEPALYSGAGFGDYVIAGRLPYVDFDRLRAEVIVPVNDAVSFFEGRTETTFIASTESLLYRDEPAIDD
jgi:hypothetical protein